MSNDDYVVGRGYGEMAPNNSALFEMLLKKAERERDEARKLAQWFYKRLKQVCIDNLSEESVDGILARLEEAVLDDSWLEEAAK